MSARDYLDLSDEAGIFNPGPVGSWLKRVIQDIQLITSFTKQTASLFIVKEIRILGGTNTQNNWSFGWMSVSPAR